MSLKAGILTLAVAMAVAACNSESTSYDTRGAVDPADGGRNIGTTGYQSSDRTSIDATVNGNGPGQPIGSNASGIRNPNDSPSVRTSADGTNTYKSTDSTMTVNPPGGSLNTNSSSRTDIVTNGNVGTNTNTGTTTIRTDAATPAAPTGQAADLDSMHTPLADNPQVGRVDKQQVPAGMSDADYQFVLTAMASGQFVVAAADKAKAHTENQQIQTLAKYVLDDHSKANGQLGNLAERKGIRAPVGPTTDQIDKLGQLDKLSGAAFDAEFLRQQKDAHTQVISLFENEANNGEFKDLRDWASATLPMLRNHLDMVNAVAGGTNISMAK